VSTPVTCTTGEISVTAATLVLMPMRSAKAGGTRIMSPSK